MSNFFYLITGKATLVAAGIVASAVAHGFDTASAVAQQTDFPDVEPGYWAQPFIQRLAQENILSGYPDGTFRPEQAVDRDEFAALIRQAYNKTEQRQIPSGSVFRDVPRGYWAAPAIEEAYETGFMNGFPGGYFRPREQVSRIQAIVSLVNGLNLSPTNTATTPQNTSPQTNTATTPQNTSPQTNTATTPQNTSPQRETQVTRARRPILPPLAVTSLMQPFLIAVRSPQAPADSQATNPPQAPADSQATNPNRPLSFVASNYYRDAEQIPQYAVEEVAAATQANIVVNYPNVQLLNPNQPLRRSTAAAIIYQTLVSQERLPAIPSNSAAYSYIVNPAVK